jgi:hypothetical protein
MPTKTGRNTRQKRHQRKTRRKKTHDARTPKTQRLPNGYPTQKDTNRPHVAPKTHNGKQGDTNTNKPKNPLQDPAELINFNQNVAQSYDIFYIIRKIIVAQSHHCKIHLQP